VPPISQLLEVQDLDLASDQLKERRLTLPERTELQQAQARAAALDDAHAALVEHGGTLSRSERELAGEVTDMATRAQESEDTLYSGTVKAAKELESLQQEARLLRGKQSELEERQMELLEELDGVEGEAGENRAERARTDADVERIHAAIAKAEGEIDAELARLVGKRSDKAPGVPEAILSKYDRLREKDGMAGRAAAPLLDGSCGGCRVRLPVVEYHKMLAEPEDALLSCSRCRRILVR
jgi:predicted  nucleic acid-binding Zn-ribbon protein